MNSRDKTILGLQNIGCVRDNSARTSKYEVYYMPAKPDTKYLVGKNGAIRKTYSTVDKSLTLTGTVFHRALKNISELNVVPERAMKELLEEMKRLRSEGTGEDTGDEVVTTQ